MIWFLWGIYAAICLALVNSFIRANPWGLSLWAMLLIITPATAMGTQFGFIKFYWGSPSFAFAWFIGAGLSAIAGFMASLFIFREQLNFLNILGIIMIMGGSWFLTK